MCSLALLGLCWFQSIGLSLLGCAALAPLGRNVLLGVLCLLVLQKLIGSQGLGILEAWYFDGTVGDGAQFHVEVFLGALDPPKWDEAFLLLGTISPSGILLPWIDLPLGSTMLYAIVLFGRWILQFGQMPQWHQLQSLGFPDGLQCPNASWVQRKSGIFQPLHAMPSWLVTWTVPLWPWAPADEANPWS